MRKFLPLILCVGLTGCADPITNLVMGGATAVSYSVIGQSPGDYALSRALHKNCDIRNPKRNNGEYCIDSQNQAALLAEVPVYCYRTLGSPDCSSQLDPHNNGAQPIVMPADRMVSGPPGLRLSDLDMSESANPMPVNLSPAPAAPTPTPRAVAPLDHADEALRDDELK